MLNKVILSVYVLLGFNLLILPLASQAVEPLPDAGLILRNEDGEPKGLNPPRPAEPVIQLPGRPATEADSGIKVLVKGWRFSGQHLLSEAQLQNLLAPAIGKELSLGELRNTVQAIDEYYQSQGYFARSVLPAQQIRDGIVELLIREGKLGNIAVDDTADIYQDDRVRRTMQAAQPERAYLKLEDIQRGILLLNDLSGGSVASTLKPGLQPGESDLDIKINPRTLFSGNLDYANAGIRSVGQNQYGGTLNINNPLNIGDLATARLQGTAGNVYGRVTYALPIGYSGFKLGLQASGLDYSLSGAFKSLEAQGSSWAGGIFASYPLLRSLNANLNINSGFDDRRYYNTSLQTVISNKEVQAAYLGVNGDFQDHLLNGAFNQFSAVMTAGTLDLSAAPDDLQVNNLTAKASGAYQKFVLSFSRTQTLLAGLRFFASISGQLATKNLDSSEKFSLGGPNGVRAYPVNEALGDQGYLLNFELRYKIIPNVDLIGFIDHGGIDLHAQPWTDSNPGVPRRYTLSGGGLGINWAIPGNFIIRGSMAQRIGSNPAHNTDGYDSDGTLKTPHFWVLLSKSF